MLLLVEDFLRDTSGLLSTLAIFVDVAKTIDAQKGPTGRITTNIMNIEENGIYHMLCNIKQISSER